MRKVEINDKYLLDSGRVFITGTQALVRLPMLQHARDQAAGLDTAGYITGYRGSPLGAFDQQLVRAAEFLEPRNITFVPGVNEDLAATSIWGTQQAELDGVGRYDGVFAIWYGKGPGVDRTGDAFRHANLAGTAGHGGVLALLGDDHACESSTTCNQSEFAMVDAMMPVLNPAGVQDIVDFGLYGWALSRYSGCWVGLKCVHDTVEASASVELPATDLRFAPPADFALPPGGLNIRWPDTPQEQEVRLHEHRLPAVRAFLRAHPLDRVLGDAEVAGLGIVTTGKSCLDVRSALAQLGIDAREASRLGVRVLKVAMPWPLEPDSIRRFSRGLRQLIVVEEKRALMEDQVKSILYASTERPIIVGKHDEQGRWLFRSAGRLGSLEIALVIGERLLALTGDDDLAARVQHLRDLSQSVIREAAPLERLPYFCAGCPHNTSTRVPEGSKALAGIGCHYMAQWMERDTARFTQMGAEGASWLGESNFSQRRHMFQNIGDGTYFHSGLLAIRATVAAGTNITFKILYNDAVAMTGGQPMDGPLTVDRITRQVHAEGATRIAVVSDEPRKYPRGTAWAPGVTVHHRDRLDKVQRELRELDGTTVIVYDQTCAAEKRRRRKRGQFPDPDRRVFINEAVCEGCGDCGVRSNCVAIVPVHTPFGRKRRIDQSACNKDYSCVAGFCPSFVTVHGGRLRSPATREPLDAAALPDAPLAAIPGSYDIVLTGVGGTGVVTVGALLGMAAHLSELGCSVLDMAGLAQKGGAVVSHVIIAESPEDIAATHVATAGADLLLGGDLVVSASAGVLSTLRNGTTHAVVNTHEMMTGDFARDANQAFPLVALRIRLREALGKVSVDFVDTTELATRLFGDSLGGHLFMLGMACQRGLLPVSATAIERAIALNGVAVAMNQQAFRWGRWFVHDRDAFEQRVGAVDEAVPDPNAMAVDELVEQRCTQLEQYQNRRYAERYRALVALMGEAERTLDGGNELTRLVALNYHKLLAYKDEYEVARLFTDGDFEASLAAAFEGDYRLEFHLAPTWFAKRDRSTGLAAKRSYGAWMMPVFRMLARFRWLRGTALDPFGYAADRRLERQLIRDYEHDVRSLAAGLGGHSRSELVARLSGPESIRGFGHIKRASVERDRNSAAASATV